MPAVATGPLCMLIGSIVGGALADALSSNEPLLVGCTAFGGEELRLKDFYLIKSEESVDGIDQKIIVDS